MCCYSCILLLNLSRTLSFSSDSSFFLSNSFSCMLSAFQIILCSHVCTFLAFSLSKFYSTSPPSCNPYLSKFLLSILMALSLPIPIPHTSILLVFHSFLFYFLIPWIPLASPLPNIHFDLQLSRLLSPTLILKSSLIRPCSLSSFHNNLSLQIFKFNK